MGPFFSGRVSMSMYFHISGSCFGDKMIVSMTHNVQGLALWLDVRDPKAWR
jgi:hypothetical protein